MLPALRGQLRYSVTVADRVAEVRYSYGLNPSSPPMVKSSSQVVVGLRDRVAIIRTLIFSSPHPYAGSGDLIEAGRAAIVVGGTSLLP